MLYTHILGTTKIDQNRKLKKIIEHFLVSKKNFFDQKKLIRGIRKIKKNTYNIQEKKLDITTFGMFPYYDKVLTTMLYIGIVPERYFDKKSLGIKKLFKISKGNKNIKPLEMTKWFNTNYHYLVPELSKISLKKFFKNNFLKEEMIDIKYLKNKTKFTLIGPITFIKLSSVNLNIKSVYKNIFKRYIKIIRYISSKKINYIQFEEPILNNINSIDINMLLKFYNNISKKIYNKIIFTSYFAKLDKKCFKILKKINSYGIHINYTIDNEINKIVKVFKKKNKLLSLGILEGNNIWIPNYKKIFKRIKKIKSFKTNKILISPNMSLEHIPYSVKYENSMQLNIKKWLSFSKEKINSLYIIKKILLFGKKYYKKEYNDNKLIIICKNEFNKYSDKIIYKKIIKTKIKKKRKKFKNTILFPTTTIGSFPQTDEIKKARTYKKEKYSKYKFVIKKNILKNINFQKDIGIDVLVHGEPERNDMVEYFCNKFYGCIITNFGWVHSYGTRYVKPPIIYGTIINRNKDIFWMKYSKEIVKNNLLKGIITGPITMLKWSFIRDNISYKKILFQFSYALRKELKKIKKIGIKIIQIDEPAFKESMPINIKEKKKYVYYAIRAFKYVFSGINNIQIHTHICYSKLDIFDIKSFNKMDIDVISIESARSFMKVVKTISKIKLNFEIGLGVFDIHSVYKTNKYKIFNVLKNIFYIFKKNIWINPDCGLKTRSWNEIIKPLKNMVYAAKLMKKKFKHKF
ncbi:5-methyltetrahydropteroyltriglutamate--homocysteine S-methyltransferase [Candidatus Vidania fulgoroideorum]